MRRRSFLLGLGAALAVAGAAEARMHAPYEAHRIVPSILPLDGSGSFSAPAAAYSFRKLKSTYGGPAVRIRRLSDSVQLDVGFTATGDFNTAAAAAHCAATSCVILFWYDQSGNGRDMGQPTAADQPALLFNCVGDKPCMSGLVSDYLASANFTSTGITSHNAVWNRRSGTAGGACLLAANGNISGNRLTTKAGAAGVDLSGLAGTLTVPSAETGWHSATGVINAASSSLTVDGGTPVAGSITPSTAAAPIYVSGSSATCDQTEAIIWNNYVLTAPEIAALTQNQQQYWAPYSLDAFAAPAGAYSFRKLKSTYSGPAIRIRRASDNAETDINFLGFVPGLGSPWDSAAATAHCAATNCYIRTIYNQSGAGTRNLEQAAAGAQPLLVFDCSGFNPCARFDADDYMMSNVSFTPTTGVTSIAGVAKRTSGGGAVIILQHGGGSGNLLGFRASVAGITLFSGTNLNTSSAENTWHSAIGVINAASSSLTVDGGAAVTGTLTATTTAGNPIFGSAAATAFDWAESVAWDAYALTAAEIAVLGSNQRSFWGF